MVFLRNAFQINLIHVMIFQILSAVCHDIAPFSLLLAVEFLSQIQEEGVETALQQCQSRRPLEAADL